MPKASNLSMESSHPSGNHRPPRRLIHLASEVASMRNYDHELLGQLTHHLHPRVITPAMQLPYKPVKESP